MLGDVNISAILDSFSVSYDKRVRPNYGGELYVIKNTKVTKSDTIVLNANIYIYILCTTNRVVSVICHSINTVKVRHILYCKF